jgi:replicative DNA helicase
MSETRSVFDDVLNEIDRGRAGLNVGLPMGMNRLVEYLPNTQQGTYYLIGAGTKVGKTTLADDCFLYNPYDYLKANPDSPIILDIDYFSYEIEKKVKIVKGIGRKLWWDHGLITDVNQILSRGNNHCSDELYNLVRGYRDYFEGMEDVVTIHDMPDNPTGMNKYLYRKANSLGTVEYEIVGKDEHGKDITRFKKYTPNNPNRYWIIIIDHIALMKAERGFNTKQNIDKMSQYLVQLRNNYNAIPVVIQQLAFDSENDERYKAGRLTPQIKDFGDSKYTTRDANVIMALFDPSRYGVERFQNYDVRRLGNTYRNLEILANRDGEPNVNIGLNFIGPAGTFRELPKASEITDANYDKAARMLR